MRSMKSLGLAFVVVLAFAAFAGAGSASASTLCKVGPSQVTCPAASLAANGTTLAGANLGNTVLTSGLGTVKCTASTFGLTVTANPGVSGNLTALTFSNCTDQFNVPCTPTPNGLPWSGSLTWLSAALNVANGSLVVNNPNVTLTGSCILAGCTYTAASVTASVYNPDSTVKPAASTHMVAKFNGVALNSNCGAATWTGTYDVTMTPYPTGGDVWIDQN